MKTVEGYTPISPNTNDVSLNQSPLNKNNLSHSIQTLKNAKKHILTKQEKELVENALIGNNQQIVENLKKIINNKLFTLILNQTELQLLKRNLSSTQQVQEEESEQEEPEQEQDQEQEPEQEEESKTQPLPEVIKINENNVIDLDNVKNKNEIINIKETEKPKEKDNSSVPEWYGYSFVDPEKWTIPQERPPVCTTEKECPVCPVIMNQDYVPLWTNKKYLPPHMNLPPSVEKELEEKSKKVINDYMVKLHKV